MVYYKVQNELLRKYGYDSWDYVSFDKQEAILVEAQKQILDKGGINWGVLIGKNAIVETASLPLSLLENKNFKVASTVIISLNENLAKTVDQQKLVCASIDLIPSFVTWLYSGENTPMPKSLQGKIFFLPKTTLVNATVDTISDVGIDKVKKYITSNLFYKELFEQTVLKAGGFDE